MDSIEDPVYNIGNINSLEGNKRNRNLITEIISNKYYDYDEIYIDDKDFSIVYSKAFIRIPTSITNSYNLNEIGISTLFEKYNNTWYPKLMDYYDKLIWYKNKTDTTDYITTKMHVLMSVNKLNLTDVKPFNKEETIKRPYTYNYFSRFKYDPVFWENYNYYPDDNLRKIVFKDLDFLEKKEKK